jgi:hypothetical protein
VLNVVGVNADEKRKGEEKLRKNVHYPLQDGDVVTLLGREVGFHVELVNEHPESNAKRQRVDEANSARIEAEKPLQAQPRAQPVAAAAPAVKPLETAKPLEANGNEQHVALFSGKEPLAIVTQEIIVLVGRPQCGKTKFAQRHLVRQGYVLFSHHNHIEFEECLSAVNNQRNHALRFIPYSCDRARSCVLFFG